MKKTSLSIGLSNETIHVLVDALLFVDRFNWYTLRHCNAEFELHVVLLGSCAIDVEDQVYPLSAGNAIVIAPSAFHSAYKMTDTFERMSLSLIVDPDSYVAELLQELSKLSAFRMTEEQLSLCRQLIEEVNGNDLFHTELCYAHLTALLISLFRIVKPELNIAGNPWKRTEFQPRNIVDLFFSSWPTPVGSEQDLAQLLHISRRQLVRFLKQNYDMSFREKYMRSRMDYAAWLLRSTTWRIGEIAQQVNYSSESAFLSAFKKYFGLTPTEYRLSYIDKETQEESE